MASRRNRWAARAAVAIVAALLAHAVGIGLFIAFGGLMAFSPSGPSAMLASRAGTARPGEDQPLQIETLVNELDEPDKATAQEQKKAQEEKKEEAEKDAKGQVVDIAKPLIEERPDKADYLAEYDSKVDHQTRGPNGRGQAGGRPASLPPPGSPDVQAPVPASAGSSGGRPGTPGPLTMREPEHRAAPARPGPRATENGDLDRAGSDGRTQEARPVPRPGQAGSGAEHAAGEGHPAQAPGLPNGRPNLNPTPDQLQRAIGRGSGSMDYLKDIDDGESTALNAKKWKFASFFNRVKRAVADQWHPELVYRIHDPNGNVYGVKDRVTVLRVHLTPEGKLAGWTLLQTSGVDFLDDEAIDAFKKAQPFPHPPKELVDSDGQIHFNFGFIFELSGDTSFKVFKYN